MAITLASLYELPHWLILVTTHKDMATLTEIFHFLQYMRGLGYCPQFFGVEGFLTGKQVLEITLALRGFYPRDITTETKNWISIVGMYSMYYIFYLCQSQSAKYMLPNQL